MRRPIAVVVSLVWLVLATAGRAQQIVEVWRSPFGFPRDVSAVPGDGCWLTDSLGLARVAADGNIVKRVYVPGGLGAVRANTADGSCWAISGNEVVHYSGSGAEFSRSGGFDHPASLSVNSTDGSCWVADTGRDQVVHLAADGAELWRGGEFTGPISVSVDPGNGSCWVADVDTDSWDSTLVHLSPTGVELWRGYACTYPSVVCVDPRDGSCLVGEYSTGGTVAAIASDGTELWRRSIGTYYRVTDLAVDPHDGSYWVGCTMVGFLGSLSSTVMHFSADGSRLWHGGGGPPSASVSVDAMDGSSWASDGRGVVHMASTGELLSEGICLAPEALSVNANDGSCWIASEPLDQVARVARDGSAMWWGASSYAWGISVNQSDGSCWVAQDGRCIIITSPPPDAISARSPTFSFCSGFQLVHLAADGTELWHDRLSPRSVSANSADGSCWVAASNGYVLRLAADGTELCRVNAGWLVAADQADGSCWVGSDDAIVHLAADGTELWQGPVVGIRSLSVSSDGSCWVGTGSAVMHLAADGTELWRGTGFDARSVSASPADSSCWVADASAGQVVHLAVDGTELWRGGSFDWTTTYVEGTPWRWNQLLAADPGDGSCWVADVANAQLVHLVPDVAFPDVPPEFWAYDEIMACAGANIVLGYPDGLYHPELEVTRDQMAVYVARALVSPSGDAAIPEPGPPPTFTDVLPDFWAYKQIEYAVSQNVVEGYEDGTYQPGLTVDRGQMAVYIARAMCAPSGDAAITDPEPPPTFPDVPETYWAFRHIEYCAVNGVVSGYEDGLYRPEDTVTRDQMAVYIARAFGL